MLLQAPSATSRFSWPVVTRERDCLNSICAWLSSALTFLPVCRRDEGDRHVPHRAETCRAGSCTHFRWASACDQVPLVDDEDARLVLLGDVVAELLVDLADPLAGVEEQQHHVGPADAALRAVRAVEVDVRPNALAACADRACRWR